MITEWRSLNLTIRSHLPEKNIWCIAFRTSWRRTPRYSPCCSRILCPQEVIILRCRTIRRSRYAAKYGTRNKYCYAILCNFIKFTIIIFVVLGVGRHDPIPFEDALEPSTRRLRNFGLFCSLAISPRSYRQTGHDKFSDDEAAYSPFLLEFIVQ